MKYITNIAGAREAVESLGTEAVVGLDIETTGLDPKIDQIRLIQVASPTEVYVFDLYQIPLRENEVTLKDVLVPLLVDGPVKISHHAKFEASFIWSLMGVMPQPIYDTLLVDQIVQGGSFGRGLKNLVQDYLGESLDKEEQQSDWGSEQLTEKQINYAARDASVLLPLKDRLDAEVSKHGLERIVDLEHQCLPAMAWMERSGVVFDQDKWDALTEKAQERVDELLERLNGLVKKHLPQPDDLFGETVRETNWNSPPQVKQLLIDLGLEVSDTRHESLVAVRDEHPIVSALVDYREAAKKLSTYGDTWAKHLHRVDGRIYPDWRQIGAATGRMACKRPNLQNLPRSPEYRECFRAADGNVLIKADYEQIELRIAAEMASDTRMKQAFAAKKDLHETTASIILGQDSVTSDERQLAKAVNFGLIYGMGARALADNARTSYGVALKEEKADEIRKKYFEAYSGIRNWHSVQGNNPETRTVLGRRRELNGDSHYTSRLNSPVQGTGADGLKLAMVKMWESRHEVNAFPIMAVHDEIVIEVPEEKADDAKTWLEKCMLEGMEEVVKEVPVTVSVKVSHTL